MKVNFTEEDFEELKTLIHKAEAYDKIKELLDKLDSYHWCSFTTSDIRNLM